MTDKFSHFKKTALVSALLLEMTAGVQATTIVVDGTTCTLADAITSANTDIATGGCTAGIGDDILELDTGGSPFTLNNPLPIINSNLTINANGSTIERNPAAAYFLILQINGGNTVLNNATITGGISNGNNNFGAGIAADFGGAIEINRSIITGNTGGAVRLYNAGPSSINHSFIVDNASKASPYYNGGVSINSGYLNIYNSTISGNSNIATNAGGGGVYVTDFSGPVNVNITNSTISGNTSVNIGGGIHSKYYSNGIQLNLNNVTLVSNTSSSNGGGLANDGGDVAVSQSLITGNYSISPTDYQWLATGTYVTVDSHNIFGHSNDAGVTGFTTGATDIIPAVAPGAIFDASLSDNGGPTPTHALIAGGPAEDVIPSCLLNWDQTLKPRPQDGNSDGTADCDVGAVETLNPDVIFFNGLNNEFW